MSDHNNSDKPKFVKIRLTACNRGGMHVTGIEPITDVDIVYDAPGSDDVLASSTVGWSRAYAGNWDRTFGDEKVEPELN